MKRIAITNGCGKWFNEASSETYKEGTYWNGHNWISMATGNQWEHEYLYITKKGRYVLNHFSNCQGSTETYDIVSMDEAARWMIKNKYDPLPGMEEIYKNLEI